MKETGLTGKGRSTTIAATPDDGKSQRKRRRRRTIQNTMDGKDYQRGSIEKDGDIPIHSETIQDRETTISRTSYKT